MGHATAEAVVRAGLSLVPFSFTGESEAVVVGNVAVSGIPVQLIGPEQRQKALEEVLSKHEGLIVIDFTLPQAVNCELDLLENYSSNGIHSFTRKTNTVVHRCLLLPDRSGREGQKACIAIQNIDSITTLSAVHSATSHM